jgi:hypothetical protein
MTIDGQRLAYVIPHRTSPPAPACAIIDFRRADLRAEAVAGKAVTAGDAPPPFTNLPWNYAWR